MQMLGYITQYTREFLIFFVAVTSFQLLYNSPTSFQAHENLHYVLYKILQRRGYEPMSIESLLAVKEKTHVKIICMYCVLLSCNNNFYVENEPCLIVAHMKTNHTQQLCEYCWYCNRWFVHALRLAGHYCTVSGIKIAPFGVIWATSNGAAFYLDSDATCSEQICGPADVDVGGLMGLNSTMPQTLRNIPLELLHPKFRDYKPQLLHVADINPAIFKL